ncbi:MAG TPA: carbohydrate ABC transporter permease [Limnochordia bacterium]|nr:carbohydrate ABC transporter permease [Limnochordia bacterium]
MPLWLRRTAHYLLATLLALWTLIPIVLIGLAALTPRSDFFTWPRTIIPSQFSLESLRFFVNSFGVLRSTGNSLLVALATVVLSLLLGAPAGYALTRFRFRGREAFQTGILITRMFPTSILAVPLAVTFIRWRLYDTLLGVTLMHVTLALPFVVMITAGVFTRVPKDLEEAAQTLGCSRLGAFFRVSLPLILPGLAASGILTFVMSWNEVFAATILTVNNRTLPAQIMGTLGASPLYFKFAGGFFMILPAILFIVAIRRYLINLWGVSINK